MKRACVVIPAFNEETSIGAVVTKTKTLGYDVIVVDDGSTDNTRAVAVKNGAEVLSLPINSGKGFAARTGLDYAVEKGCEVFVLMDGDGQHDPEEIKNLLKAIDNGADIVFGCRVRNDRMPPLFRFGNWFLEKATEVLFAIDVPDTQSGFRAMTKKAYGKVRWTANKYDMESEMIVLAGKNRVKHAEVPIKTIYDDKYKGTTVIDGVRIFLMLLWWRLW